MTRRHDARVASEQAELLRLMLGRRISSLIRYEWDSLAKAATMARPGWSLFRCAPGPLVVGLDGGVEVAFGSSPPTASVVVWLERDQAGIPSDRGALADQPDLYAIRAEDTTYGDRFVAGFVGSQLVGVEVWQRQATLAKLQALPRDAGVVLIAADGRRLVIGHGLHDGSDDLAVIEPAQIDRHIRPQLVARLELGQPPA